MCLAYAVSKYMSETAVYLYIYVLALCISKIVKTAKNWTNTVADNKKKHIVCLACAVSKYKSKC